MNAHTQEILRAALALDADDRSLVADLLYGSLDPSADQATTDQSGAEEVARRVRDVDAGRADLVSMDEVVLKLG